jgi:hypothetical protein
MYAKLFSFSKRMLTHAHHLLIASFLLLVSALLFRTDLRALIIPTDNATHTATLSKVILGASGDQQMMVFDPSQGRVVISGGVVIGEIEPRQRLHQVLQKTDNP